MRVVASDVSKTIGPAALLAPVSLDAPSGSCVVLRGANGSGKTTLLRILTGTLPPSTGTVQIGELNADERDPAIRAAVAALVGPPATYRDLTLRDHLTLIDASWGGDIDTCEDRVTDTLETFGISALAARFPHELSSGQTQLFRLALTFFRPGRVLVLDEPEQRLDTDHRAHIAQLICERRETGTTVLMACHDPAITERVTAGGGQIIDLAPAEV